MNDRTDEMSFGIACLVDRLASVLSLSPFSNGYGNERCVRVKTTGDDDIASCICSISLCQQHSKS